MITTTLEQAQAPFLTNQYATVDADEHAACLRDWGQCYDQLSAGTFAGEFEEFCFGNVQLFRERINQSIHESGQPWSGSRTFGVTTELEGTGCFCGDPLEYDSLIALTGGRALDFRTPRTHALIAVTVQSNALNNYAQQVEHRDLDTELQGIDLLAPPPAQVDKLRQFLSTVLSSLRATPHLLSHEPMRTALEHAIFASILDVVGPAQEMRPAPSGRTRHVVVERAREFMQQHIEEPISVEELCIHLGVSRRTLQYSFQDVLGLNPVKFLRALRLNGVRRALKRASPTDTVADIAARWGFWHLSHFAAEYRAMFDELPSETLRRSGLTRPNSIALVCPSRLS